MSDWISVNERLPDTQGYYEVKLANGDIDEKWCRIRRGIHGFMSEDSPVVAWKINLFEAEPVAEPEQGRLI